jgi:hypothetical protein
MISRYKDAAVRSEVAATALTISASDRRIGMLYLIRVLGAIVPGSSVVFDEARHKYYKNPRDAQDGHRVKGSLPLWHSHK